VADRVLRTYFDALADEVKFLRASTEGRFQELFSRLTAIEDHLAHHMDDQARLKSAIDDQARLVERLDTLVRAQTEALTLTVGNETAALRADIVELTRMLRMQGDAADQVAEVLGRALTRLSSEVETLSEVVGKSDLAPTTDMGTGLASTPP
jgi:class 3 adenylate cyclase